MPANKKITDQIAEDIRAKYQSGEYTQSDLSIEFKVSVPTINKTVKGVKPAKRKYTHRTSKYAERNAEIVKLYQEDGMTMHKIAEQMNTSHQNISLILHKSGINPQERYFSQLSSQKNARTEKIEAKKAAKQAAKERKVEHLSELWIGGATIDEIREAAGLNSNGAAQVKLVHLRKKYGLEVFPKRSAFGMTVEKRAAQRAEKDRKASELSELWKQGATPSEMASVFDWVETSVTRRIPKLRREYGEDMFPYRRQPRAQVAEITPEEEVTFGDELVEEVTSEVETPTTAEVNTEASAE